MGIVLGSGGWWRVRVLGALALAFGLVGCSGGSTTVATSIVTASGPPNRSAGAFTAYAVPTKNGSPEAITLGPDGNLWFTELNKARIGSITPQGVLGREFAMPDVTAAAPALTVGPDRNLWFTNTSFGRVGYVTTAGAFKQFNLSSTYARPLGITSGPDNALWFTESAASINGQILPAIGRITISGTITEYAIPNLASAATSAPTSIPQMIVAGPDGKLWFTDAGNNAISSITTDGTIKAYAIKTAGSRPFSIIAGMANDLWFTEQNGLGHLRIDTGKITEYPLPTSGGGVRGLALAPDGSLWCSQFQTSMLTHMTPDGTFTDYPLAGNGERPDQMVIGPDGLLWFTAPGSNTIDAFALP